MALLSESLPNHSKSALDNLERIGLDHLHRCSLLASQLDTNTRPAVTTIQQGVRGRELHHRRNENLDGLPVDLDRDHTPHQGDKIVDGLNAPVPREDADVVLQLALLDGLRLDRSATRIAAVALREWSPTWTAYDARLAHVSCFLCCSSPFSRGKFDTL
jgi:hypothetical protein